MTNDEFLTLNEYANRYKVSRQTAKKHAESIGALIRISGTYRISKEIVTEWEKGQSYVHHKLQDG